MARRRSHVRSFALLCSALVISEVPGPNLRAADVRELASRILDDSQDRDVRARLIEEHPKRAVELLREMVRDLEPGTKEEYRRIPWIWRVTIAAGRRNSEQELRKVLDVSLPEADGPLHDWQAVVIGGGVINGISQQGVWPGERIAEVLRDRPELEARWQRSLELASAMADNEKVPTGTRYDALRMLGMEPWERRGAQLTRYLKKGTHDELQMGAVSALGDMRSPEATAALLSAIGHYSERNRELTLDALVRSRERREALREAVAEGRVDAAWVGEKRAALLRADGEETETAP